MNLILLTVSTGLLILICIHKLYIIYLELYVVPIGQGFSFFLLMEKSWKINVEKEGAPCLLSASCKAHEVLENFRYSGKKHSRAALFPTERAFT